MSFRSTVLLVATVSICAEFAAAENFLADPSNYQEIIRLLQAGDTVSLTAGIYTEGIDIEGMHGTERDPITVSGPKEGSPATFLANSSRNTVQLNNASYIIMRHLTLDGQELTAPFGVASDGVTHDITVEYLKIIGYSGDQATVGISTKGPAWQWTIAHNTIVGAGTGMYLGNSDGNFPFIAGLIEHNLILDTIGYSIQIKHQNPRPNDIGIPGGANKTTIRNNVFRKNTNASSGSNSRPSLLVGHLPLSGNGMDDVYEIYRNFFYQNPGDALFQGEGNIAFFNNLLINNVGSGIAIQRHNDVPRVIRIFENIVLASGTGISVTGGDSRFFQVVSANAVFAGNPIFAMNQSGNIIGGYFLADGYFDNLFAGLAAGFNFLDPGGCITCRLICRFSIYYWRGL